MRESARVSAAALAVLAVLAAGCGCDGSPRAPSSPAEEPAARPGAVAPGSITAEMAKPTEAEVDIRRRMDDLESRFAALAEDDPARAELLEEARALRKEAGRANREKLARNSELAKRLILEKRRGGAK